MKAVIQRVLNANVVVGGALAAEIEKGILALIAFAESDDQKTIEFVFNKILELRIFEDENDKMNLSVLDQNLGILIVPNFTVYGDASRGRRPNFTGSASFSSAEKIFGSFKAYAKNRYDKVAFGIFGADMKVGLVNDGPIALIIEK